MPRRLTFAQPSENELTTLDYVNGIDQERIIQTAEVNLVATLKPTLSIDGNKWCWLLGEDLQNGVAGFGDSPYLAALDFNRAFYQPLQAKP